MRPARQLAQETYLSRLRTNRRARRRGLHEANKRPAGRGRVVTAAYNQKGDAHSAEHQTIRVSLHRCSFIGISQKQSSSCNRRLCRATTLALQPCQSAAEQSNRRLKKSARTGAATWLALRPSRCCSPPARRATRRRDGGTSPRFARTSDCLLYTSDAADE